MKDFGLVVGIDHYKDDSLNPLGGAINDAERFHSWLVSNDGGGLAPVNCQLLSSNDGLTKVFKDDIDDAFEQLYIAAREDREETRRFYFFFSGHGLGVGLDEVALIVTNWTRILANRGLSSQDFHNRIRQSGVFSETFFFLDCCRSKKVNVMGQSTGFWLPGINDQGKEVQSFTAYATRYSDVAYESDENSRMNGYFTTALMEGLSGVAANEKGEVLLSGLKGHLTVRTEELARLKNRNQQVRFEDSFTEDPVFIQLKMDEGATDDAEQLTTVRLFYGANMEGEYEIFDKEAEPRGVLTAENSPLEIKLSHGLAVLSSTSNKGDKSFRVVKDVKEVQDVRFE